MKRLQKFRIKYTRNPKKRAEYIKKGRMLGNIGDECEIFSGVNFGSEPYLIEIGNQVRITSGVKFVTHDGGLWVIRNMGLNKNADKMGKIKIGNNVFIGWDSIIMPNVSIGNNVIVGSGSIVTKDIPDNSVVAGVPAKILCTVEEYYEKNRHKLDETKHLSSADKKKYYLNKFNGRTMQ